MGWWGLEPHSAVPALDEPERPIGSATYASTPHGKIPRFCSPLPAAQTVKIPFLNEIEQSVLLSLSGVMIGLWR